MENIYKTLAYTFETSRVDRREMLFGCMLSFQKILLAKNMQRRKTPKKNKKKSYSFFLSVFPSFLSYSDVGFAVLTKACAAQPAGASVACSSGSFIYVFIHLFISRKLAFAGLPARAEVVA